MHLFYIYLLVRTVNDIDVRDSVYNKIQKQHAKCTYLVLYPGMIVSMCWYWYFGVGLCSWFVIPIKMQDLFSDCCCHPFKSQSCPLQSTHACLVYVNCHILSWGIINISVETVQDIITQMHQFVQINSISLDIILSPNIRRFCMMY